MRIRVIQWATGPIGAAELRELITNPAFELVGVFVYSADKVETDAGALVGLPPTGVLATNDKAKILALDADVVLHAASKAFGIDSSLEDILALLASGKNVISTTSYTHIPTLGKQAYERFEQACAQGKSRFLAAGEHPGFMFERLAVSLTALSQRIDTIVVQEFVDCSHVTQPEMLTNLMGMGKQPEQISTDSPVFRSMSVEFEQSLAAAAHALGLRIDEIRTDIKTALASKDVVMSCTTLPAGTVAGQILRWTAYHNGIPVLVAEEYWTCTKDLLEWNIPAHGGHTVRVFIKGAPNLSLELNVDLSRHPELGGASGGAVAVAMSAVRAIPDVLAAPPGIVIPKIFGAYRWPT